MSEREEILGRLRGVTSGTAVLPSWDNELVVARSRLGGATLWDSFRTNFGSVNGRTMGSAAELAAFLEAGGYSTGFCDPALMDQVGGPLARAGLQVSDRFDRAKVDEYRFGVTRGRGVIAETGTVVFDDVTTVDRLAALAPWVHVAVVQEAELWETVGDAIAALGDAPNIVWATGPSKTADVEGILIEGVHGPGEQVCLVLGEQ